LNRKGRANRGARSPRAFVSRGPASRLVARTGEPSPKRHENRGRRSRRRDLLARVNPGANRPANENRGANRPVNGNPGANRPANGNRGASRAATENPGANRPESGNPGANQPVNGNPGANRPANGNRGRPSLRVHVNLGAIVVTIESAATRTRTRSDGVARRAHEAAP